MLLLLLLSSDFLQGFDKEFVESYGTRTMELPGIRSRGQTRQRPANIDECRLYRPAMGPVLGVTVIKTYGPRKLFMNGPAFENSRIFIKPKQKFITSILYHISSSNEIALKTDKSLKDPNPEAPHEIDLRIARKS